MLSHASTSARAGSSVRPCADSLSGISLLIYSLTALVSPPDPSVRLIRAVGQVADRGDNPRIDEMVTLIAMWLVPLVVLFGVVYFAVRLATRNSRVRSRGHPQDGSVARSSSPQAGWAASTTSPRS